VSRRADSVPVATYNNWHAHDSVVIAGDFLIGTPDTLPHIHTVCQWPADALRLYACSVGAAGLAVGGKS
jgi:hypothetical protein